MCTSSYSSDVLQIYGYFHRKRLFVSYRLTSQNDSLSMKIFFSVNSLRNRGNLKSASIIELPDYFHNCPQKTLLNSVLWTVTKMIRQCQETFVLPISLHLIYTLAVSHAEKYKWPVGIQPIKMQAALMKHRIIPDCVDGISKYDLWAEFEEDKTIYYGNFIQPTADTEWLAQHIEWDAKQLDHFTMMLLGLDEPTEKNPSKREYIFWLITNIHSYAIEGGDEIIEYKQPKVAQGSGVHRYVFIVYIQPNDNLTMTWKPVNSTSETHRANFNQRKFAKKHKLGKPWAMNFFINYWLPPGATSPGPSTLPQSTPNIWQRLAAEAEAKEKAKQNG
ncbi:uncharacterized protein [Bemisia tabaci]|uniref:uncharacterized protein isoform X2 n=1 Tax=Bemisia tabaci TaxID=7038 RepID=UPI003B2806B1